MYLACTKVQWVAHTKHLVPVAGNTHRHMLLGALLVQRWFLCPRFCRRVIDFGGLSPLRLCTMPGAIAITATATAAATAATAAATATSAATSAATATWFRTRATALLPLGGATIRDGWIRITLVCVTTKGNALQHTALSHWLHAWHFEPTTLEAALSHCTTTLQASMPILPKLSVLRGFLTDENRLKIGKISENMIPCTHARTRIHWNTLKYTEIHWKYTENTLTFKHTEIPNHTLKYAEIQWLKYSDAEILTFWPSEFVENTPTLWYSHLHFQVPREPHLLDLWLFDPCSVQTVVIPQYY